METQQWYHWTCQTVQILQCVKNCTNLKILEINEDTKECVSECPEKAPYLSVDDSKCVKECDEEQFILGTQCLSECPKYWVSSSRPGPNKTVTQRICVDDCTSQGINKLRSGSQCVSQCPDKLLEQEGVCVEKCGPEYAEAQKERKCDNQCSYYEENKRRTCTTAIGLCSTTNFPFQRVLANGRIRCVSESECHEQSYYVQSNGERRCGYCAGVYRVDALSQFRVCIAESECAGVIRAGQCHEGAACPEGLVLSGKTCQSRCGQNSFRDAGICKNTCASGLYSVTSGGERVCVASCGNLSVEDSDTGLRVCVKTCDPGEFALGGACVGKCESGAYVNRSGALSCASACEYFIQNSELGMRRCFNSCAQSEKKFALASSQGAFECVDGCPPEYPLAEAGECKKVCASGTFENWSFSGGPECVPRCSGNFSKSTIAYNHYVCVGRCGRGQLFVPGSDDESVGECITASACPDGRIADAGGKCVENCPFFTDVSGVAECYSVCPPGYPRGVSVGPR